MKCPRCGAENQEDVRYCCQCGLSRETPNINLKKEPAKVEKEVDYNIPMNFHMFYTIALMVLSILGILFSGIMLFVEDGFMMSFMAFPPSAAILAISILLLLRNKVGNILRLILNIVMIVRHAFTLLTGIVFGIIFGIFLLLIVSAAEAESAIIIFAICFFGVVVAILYAIASIVINALIINYYSKRKHMFH